MRIYRQNQKVDLIMEIFISRTLLCDVSGPSGLSGTPLFPPHAPFPLLLPHQFYAVEREREIQSPSRAAQEVLSAGRFLHKPKHNCCNLISFSQKNEEICSFFGNRWQMTGDRRPNKQLAVPSRALYLAIRVGRGLGVNNELLEYLTVKLSLHEEQHLAEI